MSKTLPAILAALSLSGIAACDDPDRAERAEDTTDGEDAGEPEAVEVDEDAVLAQADNYATELMQLSAEREFEETHADAAAVLVWGSAGAANKFLSIDPDDPTQRVDFEPGTMFVKEHFNEAGDTIGLTVMYKADAGYDPDGGDWFWARKSGSDVTESGRVDWCSNCHAAAINSDFVVGFGKSE